MASRLGTSMAGTGSEREASVSDTPASSCQLRMGRLGCPATLEGQLAWPLFSMFACRRSSWGNQDLKQNNPLPPRTALRASEEDQLGKEERNWI